MNAFLKPAEIVVLSLVLSVSSAQAVDVPEAAARLRPSTAGSAEKRASDSRMRSLTYQSNGIVSVPVARGVATHIVLMDDEVMQLPPATGKGADCKKEADTWCITATGRDVFVKPKAGASNTDMAIVTTRRRYTFLLDVLPAAREQEAVLQLSFAMPPAPPMPPVAVEPAPPTGLSAQELIDNRMRAAPVVRNAAYSVAVGENSEDIVPVMVFDDGTQTYFSFPNNRPIPTVFQTAPDQSEEMVNVRMQNDLLIADRVGRRFVLRLGDAVVAVINEKFDIDGQPPVNGTTVPGLLRVLRAELADSLERQP